MKQIIKKIPILGWFVRWLYNLLRLNNIKHNLFLLQESEKKNNLKLEQLQEEYGLKLKQLQEENDLKLNIKIEQVQQENDLKLNNLKDEILVKLTQPSIPNSIQIQADDYLKEALVNLPQYKNDVLTFDQKELYYSLFENVFYNHKVVLEKQKVYLHCISENNSINYPHLDIGCGRGEFLTILKDANYTAQGIDINSLEVNQLIKKGFKVEQADMLVFLQTTTQTFSSISALQVVEHIDYATLKKFLQLSYENLQTDGSIILETINPHNKVAFNSFYMDETHKRPLPPEMLAFMLQFIGFKNVQLIYTSPMPEEFRSKENLNINYHDYAVVGYKL